RGDARQAVGPPRVVDGASEGCYLKSGPPPQQAGCLLSCIGPAGPQGPRGPKGPRLYSKARHCRLPTPPRSPGTETPGTSFGTLTPSWVPTWAPGASAPTPTVAGVAAKAGIIGMAATDSRATIAPSPR